MTSPSRKYLALLLAGYTVVLLAACFWPFNFFQENRVAVTSDGLVFSEPGIVYTNGVANLEDLTSFTVLAELSAALPGQASWVISYGLDFDALNLLVGLYVDQLIVETRRGQQTMRASMKGALQREKRTWLVVVGLPGLLRVYLDGKLIREVTREQPDTTRWNAGYPLVIGARSDGKYPWRGVLHNLAILDRAASPETVQHPESLMVSGPIVSLDLTGASGRQIANQGTGETGSLTIPEKFVPYRRAMLMDITDLWTPGLIWGDILLNIVAFVPIGLLLALLLRKKFRPVSVLLVVLLAAFGLSLSVEMLQVYLPRRWSTFTDVATNSLGALLGGSASLLAIRGQKKVDTSH